MTEPGLDVLAQRLDRMERRLRRWRLFGSLTLTVLAAGIALNLALLLGNPLRREIRAEDEETEDEGIEESIRARAFFLVDEDGTPRAAMTFRADGTPALAFSDRNGKVIWKAP